MAPAFRFAVTIFVGWQGRPSRAGHPLAQVKCELTDQTTRLASKLLSPLVRRIGKWGRI